MGNVHFKWAFSEASALFLRHATGGKTCLATLEKKHGKGKAVDPGAQDWLGGLLYRVARHHLLPGEVHGGLSSGPSHSA